MKLYRVLPDILYRSNEHRGRESIFNMAEYAMYDVRVYKNNYRGENSIYNGLREESMYFYFFPEDAVRFGTKLFLGNAFRLVEYDIPEELIIENAGVGIYGSDCFGIGPIVLETAVAYSKLGDNVICPVDLDRDTKIKMILDSYKETISLQKFFFNNDILSDLDEYLDSFEYEEVYDEINDDEISIVKTPFLTGNIWGFVEGFKEKNKEYLEKRGLILDYSKEGEEKREYILKEANEYIKSNAFPDFNYINKVVRNKIPEYNKVYQKKY